MMPGPNTFSTFLPSTSTPSTASYKPLPQAPLEAAELEAEEFELRRVGRDVRNDNEDTYSSSTKGWMDSLLI